MSLNSWLKSICNNGLAHQSLDQISFYNEHQGQKFRDIDFLIKAKTLDTFFGKVLNPQCGDTNTVVLQNLKSPQNRIILTHWNMESRWVSIERKKPGGQESRDTVCL